MHTHSSHLLLDDPGLVVSGTGWGEGGCTACRSTAEGASEGSSAAGLSAWAARPPLHCQCSSPAPTLTPAPSAADVWSWGVLCWEMFYGGRAYAGLRAPNVIYKASAARSCGADVRRQPCCGAEAGRWQGQWRGLSWDGARCRTAHGTLLLRHTPQLFHAMGISIKAQA